MTQSSAMEVDRAFDRAMGAIRDAPDVALACHVSPDGDALGSMLGLFHVLRSAGTNCVASFPTPFVVAPHYRELPGLDRLTPPHDFPSEPAVMVTFDCGSLGRLGDLEQSAKSATELVVIDHHISNDRYGSINAIDPDAAASGSLVYRLVRMLAMPLSRDAAVCLYAALVCDTGRFQYDTTTPAVFSMARELVQHDVPVSRLSRTLFEEHRFAYLKLLGDALSGAHLVPERRFVCTAEAEVTCVLKEEADGTVRVSLRSLGEVDVRGIAEAEGGGGHRFAAGFSSDDGVEAVVGRIQHKLPIAR